MKSGDKNTESFLSLLMADQRKIHSYIYSLVPNFSDADDIMQQTISTMWKKFDQFEVGTSFASWGTRIAYYHIMNYRKKKSRDIVCINDNIFQQINQIAKEKHSEADVRIEKLRNCIQKLTPNEKLLLKARYELNYSVKILAAQLNKSVQYVYKHISRIHYLLSICIKRQIHEEAGA